MEIIKQNYLNKLNSNQKEAIINPDGPCLIVAGAGSGKTKVLTTRVVNIIKDLLTSQIEKCKIELQIS